MWPVLQCRLLRNFVLVRGWSYMAVYSFQSSCVRVWPVLQCSIWSPEQRCRRVANSPVHSPEQLNRGFTKSPENCKFYSISQNARSISRNPNFLYVKSPVCFHTFPEHKPQITHLYTLTESHLLCNVIFFDGTFGFAQSTINLNSGKWNRSCIPIKLRTC